ncbi:A24 family peptidase [Microvirga yunnanensis]|uniref:A24 family peptidase n=1 Tax=Microvirga yunnanensis TaxID=2953740 RepID=UPI0021C8F872|nr:prepilin peptidase [Microvirga sp. HBU65207]
MTRIQMVSIELTCMTVSILAALAASLCFTAAMIRAGVMDLLTMKIHNGLVLALLLAYAVLAPAGGLGLAEIGCSVAVALIILAGAFLFFTMGWIGGGDAKLAAVTALWLGTEHTSDYILYTALFGSALTAALLGFRRLNLPPRWRDTAWITRLHHPRTGVPYGAAMALAALSVFPHTAWLAVFGS